MNAPHRTTIQIESSQIKLQSQRVQYSSLRHLIRHITALLQRDRANNRVHRVGENEVDSRPGKVFGLAW